VVFWVGCGKALGVSPRTFGVALAVALRLLVAGARLVRDRVQPVTPRRCRLQPTTMQYGTE